MPADPETGPPKAGDDPMRAGTGTPFASPQTVTTSKTPGLILSALGPAVLSEILHEFLDLLESSCAVYERNGDCAMSLFSPGWCQFFAVPPQSLGNEMSSHCQEFHWDEASLRAMSAGQTVDVACGAGSRVLAAPIRSQGETIGSITVGYGDPPRDPSSLRELAERYGVSQEDLRVLAEASPKRPEFLIVVARKRLLSASQMIGAIVDRKRAEESLRRSESFMAGVFEQSPLSMWITDHEGTMIRMNQACRDLFHITDGEVLDKYNVLRDNVLEEQGLMPLVRSVYERGETVRYEVRYDSARLRGVSVRHTITVVVDVSMFPICDIEGRVTNVLVQQRDITEHRALESQLAQSQKLESLGRLAGGIAHDFNNLLTVINGYSGLLLERTYDGDPLRPLVEQIRKAGERAASLTQQLLAFGRKQAAQPRPMNINALVEESHSMLARLLGEDIEVIHTLEPDLGQVMMDPGQMHQVLMNLLVNARDAMPNGGKVIVETSNVVLDDDYRVTHPGVTPGPYVLLAVSDNGVGMDEETQRHLFEPFFTTKPQGSGTGLGLSLVYGIVRQHNGWIWVYSEAGKGTTLKVYLPRIEAPVAASVQLQQTIARRGSGTILLVEDQSQVRDLALEILELHGYRVLQAAGGAEAMEVSRSHPETIHLLLTDVVMPGMTGKELADRLRAERPDMRVLYMSGYTEATIMHHGVLDEGVEYLPKPFTADKLALRVQQVLGDSTPTA